MIINERKKWSKINRRRKKERNEREGIQCTSKHILFFRKKN